MVAFGKGAAQVFWQYKNQIAKELTRKWQRADLTVAGKAA
jgi:hypothetical protein